MTCIIVGSTAGGRLIVVLIMKILVVRYYRELMRFVPTLGMIVFGVAPVVLFSALNFLLSRGSG